MRRIHVDFAPTARINPRFWTAALSVLVITGSWQAWHIAELQQLLKTTRENRDEIEQQIGKIGAKQKEQEDRALEAAQAPEAKMFESARQFPLNDVLTSVESSRVDGIRLTSLEISASDGTVRLECEYTDLEKLLQYVRRLNENSILIRWQMSSAHANAFAGPASWMSAAAVITAGIDRVLASSLSANDAAAAEIRDARADRKQ